MQDPPHAQRRHAGTGPRRHEPGQRKQPAKRLGIQPQAAERLHGRQGTAQPNVRCACHNALGLLDSEAICMEWQLPVAAWRPCAVSALSVIRGRLLVQTVLNIGIMEMKMMNSETLCATLESKIA